MERYEIRWSEEFECLCGDCPQTCCRGWIIPLEDDDIIRLKKTKGKLGAALFFATAGYTRAKFNTGSGKCPFHDKDGLCRLQKEKGHEFIPWTCQSFPRFYRNYGYFEESCLDLSCIGAAKIFLRNLWNTETVKTEGEARTELCATNDDLQYLQFLKEIRSEIIEMIEKVFTGEYSFGESTKLKDCGRFTDALFSFAVRLQDVSAAGNEQELYRIRFSDMTGAEKDAPQTKSSFPLPPSAFSRMLSSSLYHPKLRTVNPELYDMLIKAKAMMSRRMNWEDEVRAFFDADPDFLETLGSYLSYYIYQYLMRAYETYSFRRQIGLGIVHTGMIFLLAMVKAQEGKLTEDVIARIIASYNRRAYFNDGIQDDMYRIFEEMMQSEE